MGQVEKIKITEGVSTSVFFDMSEEDAIHREQGTPAYVKYMLERADEPLKLGRAFNDLSYAFNDPEHFDIVVCSRNSPLTARRALLTFQKEGITPVRMFFTNGKPIVPYLKAYDIDHFRSTNQNDVKAANALRILSGYYKPELIDSSGNAIKVSVPEHGKKVVSLLGQVPVNEPLKEVFGGKVSKHIVFDLDGVVFGPESEEYFQRNGLELYMEWEKSLKEKPMSKGPAYNVLKKYSDINNQYAGEHKPFIISVVTARGHHAAIRAIETLHYWGIDINGETHFRGGGSKEPIFKIMRPLADKEGYNIEFLDDQGRYIQQAENAGIELAGQVLMDPDPSGAA